MSAADLRAAELRTALARLLAAVHEGRLVPVNSASEGYCASVVSAAEAANAAPDQPAAQPGVSEAKDAARYRWLRDGVAGARDLRGRQSFDLPEPHPLGNIMQGSVAQHFDAAIDAALAAQAGSKTP